MTDFPREEIEATVAEYVKTREAIDDNLYKAQFNPTNLKLQEAFAQFGTVTSSKVISDRETGRSRGFAFLEMETDDQGAAAMQAMNGALLDGRSIAVRQHAQKHIRLVHIRAHVHACLYGWVVSGVHSYTHTFIPT